MGRPVEIDRDEAFQRAYALFWDRGYGSTSLNDLLQELGVGRSSFYAAFVSKQALFLGVLVKYQEQIEEKFLRIRAKHRGLSALQAYLYQSGVNVSATQRRKGCLAVNTTLELAGVDDELHEKAASILGKIEIDFGRNISRMSGAGGSRRKATTRTASANVLDCVARIARGFPAGLEP